MQSSKAGKKTRLDFVVVVVPIPCLFPSFPVPFVNFPRTLCKLYLPPPPPPFYHSNLQILAFFLDLLAQYISAVLQSDDVLAKKYTHAHTQSMCAGMLQCL